MRLLIAGRGRMADELVTRCEDRGMPYLRYPVTPNHTEHDCTIGVYVGSKARYPGFLSVCRNYGIPVLQCASDVDSGYYEPDIPIVDVPNAALSVHVFIEQVRALAVAFKTQGVPVDWKLTESHQTSKKTPGRTAELLAAILGIPKEQIKSLRNSPRIHARHVIRGLVQGTTESYNLVCSVEGLTAYSAGMIKLATLMQLQRPRLRNRLYTMSDFL